MRSKRLFSLGLFLCLVTAVANCNPASCQLPSQIQSEPKVESENVTEVFYLQFVKADDALRTVEALFSEAPKLTISADPRINALLLRADPKVAKEVQTLLKVLDTQQPRAQKIMTLPLNPDNADGVVRALREFDLMSSVEVAATAEGLIVRGTEENVAIAEDLIRKLEGPTKGKSQDVAIQLIWLTEMAGENRTSFQGRVADQLAERGFKPLSILSELEITTIVGGKCEASGAAGRGNIFSQIETHKVDDRIVLELQVEARYVVSDETVSDINFSTELTTPLERWIVFGVAQRQTNLDAEAATTRDLFLIRVNEQAPLDP